MAHIVTTHYRYKRPPRRKKAAALEGPAVVKAASTRTRPKPAPANPEPAHDDRTPAPPPAASAIVTARRPGKRYVRLPDMTEEEHRRRGDAADGLFREVVRRIKRRP
jgi:hypothetical protein